MILSADSPLKHLPTRLNPRQAMFLDATRFTIEMADFAMERLLAILSAITSPTPANLGPHSFAVPPFLDAWSIVDSIHRLRGLFERMPGLAKKNRSPEFRRFLTVANDVKILRDAVQHMKKEIGAIADVPRVGPIWGVLTWVTFQPDGCCISSTLVSGSTNLIGSITCLNPAGKLPRRLPIDYVTLAQGGAQVDITAAIDSVATLARIFEESIRETIMSFPDRGGSDIIMHFVGDLSPDGSRWTMRASNSKSQA
ncbi:MAG: hypothetical protein ACREQF_13085 [Candidatus Binataceae bacterium]